MKKPMSHNIVLLLIAVLGYVAAGVIYLNHVGQKPAVTVQPKQADVSATVMKPTIEYVNAIRAEHSLPALQDNEALDTSALAKANDMVTRDYYAHQDPSGQQFYNFIFAQAPNLHEVGENIGRCYKNQNDVYAAFKNSPTHLANIVDPDYTLYGSAMVWNEAKHCMYWVDHFGGY